MNKYGAVITGHKPGDIAYQRPRTRSTILPEVDMRPSMEALPVQAHQDCVGHGVPYAARDARRKWLLTLTDEERAQPGWGGMDDVPLSRLQCYYEARSLEAQHVPGRPMTDSGCSINTAALNLQDHGLCAESLHPYSSGLNSPPNSNAIQDGAHRKVQDYSWLSINYSGVINGSSAYILDDFRQCLSDGHMLAFGMRAYDGLSHDANNMLLMPHANAGDGIGHCMVLAGHSIKGGFFIALNWWGAGFGDHGTCRIPDDYMRNSFLVFGVLKLGAFLKPIPTTWQERLKQQQKAGV